PGRTMRYRSSYSIENNQNFSYPYRIKIFGDWIDILRQAAKESEEAAIKVASYDQMLSNSLKNYQGMLEGFKKGHLLKKKRAEERAFIEWVNSDKKLKAKYGDVLPEIAKLYEEYKTFREKSSILAFMRFGCVPLQAASIIYRWSEEKVKKDIDREPGYQERDVPDLKRRLKVMQRSFYEPADRRVLKYFIMLALKLPENQRIRAIDEIVAGKTKEEYESAVDAFLNNLYSNTKLKSVDERLRMFELSKKELLKENDSFIEFAAKLTDEFKEMETKAKAFNGAVTKLRPRLIEAYMKWKGGDLYPDANSTMRLTYGTVKGYSPRDAVSYYYITSLTGVIEKNTGEAPFNCPKRLLELYEKKEFGRYIDPVINDVPVDFLSTCDITGGNSGSPILNGRGEVIGAAFDGNYESISADYLFNEKLTRAISVDARYILFILDKFSGAQNLLDEMEIR
ncbi:S46 family peptidase, partial [Thermococci archaeon]